MDALLYVGHVMILFPIAVGAVNVSYDNNNSSQGRSLALEVKGGKVSETHRYVTKRGAGGEVEKYNREWVLVSPG